MSLSFTTVLSYWLNCPFILPTQFHIFRSSISSHPIWDSHLPSLISEVPFLFPLWSQSSLFYPETEAAGKLCKLAGPAGRSPACCTRGSQAGRLENPQKTTTKNRQKKEGLFEALCLSTEASLLLLNGILVYQQRGKCCGQKAHSRGHLGNRFLSSPLNFYPSLYFNSSSSHRPFGGAIPWKEILYDKLSLPVWALNYESPNPFIQPSFPPTFHLPEIYQKPFLSEFWTRSLHISLNSCFWWNKFKDPSIFLD